MKKSKFYLSFTGMAVFAIAIIMISITSCKKSEQTVTPAPPSNEFLTTVILECINNNAPYDTTISIWRDLTPNGSNLPDTSEALLNFNKNSTYSSNVYILDESKTSKDSLVYDTGKFVNKFNINKLPSTTANVTTEIRARQNYHLICFTMYGGIVTNLSVVRDDYDNNSPPLQVGLIDTYTTLNPSTGRMEVVLHHQPNVKNGDCSPGSIDFDVTYGVTIH